MLLTKVVGTVVASHKVEGIHGHKLLLLQPVDIHGSAKDSFLVATDSVGAGVGELVLCCQGSSARLTEMTKDKPIDAVVVAIVDEINSDGKQVFNKTMGHI